MSLLTADPVFASSGPLRIRVPRGAFELSIRNQILIGIGVTLVLGASMFLTQSLLPIAALIGVGALFAVIRNGVASVFAVILINVALTVHGKDATTGNAPSVFDLVLGVVLAGIFGYWLVRIRLIDRETLSHFPGQLLMALFFVWSVGGTIIGITNQHNSFMDGLRELLNLAPLLVLPILYERFIEPGSVAERRLFSTVLFAGFIIIIWNLYVFHNNVARAYFLYQTGRSALDLSLTCLTILILTSILMVVRRRLIIILSILFLFLAFAGLAASFTRTMYVAVLFGIMVVWMLGNTDERKLGIRHALLAGSIFIVLILPVLLSIRIIHLLLMSFGARFITLQHGTRDLSLLNRFAEWRDEWTRIIQAPILGHGFGTQFRAFNIILRSHEWMGFSHNSYLYLIFKTGFVGMSLFVLSSAWYLNKAFKLSRSKQLLARDRVVIRGVAAFILITLIGAYTGPTFDLKPALIWMGMAFAYILSLGNRDPAKGG